MNILFISHYSDLYGANRSLLLLLDGLTAHNIYPLVIVPRYGKFIDELKKRGIPYKIIKFKSWVGKRDKLFLIKAILRVLINLILLPVILFYTLRFKPEVIYTNSSVTPVGIYLSLILRVPHIWHVRELIREHYNLEYDFGKKIFFFLMRKSNIIISISEYVKRELFPGKWGNLFVINNGISSNQETNLIMDSSYIDTQSFTFLIMGIIHPSKGIHDAVQAMGKVKNKFERVRLLIFGEIEDKLYKNYLDDLIIKSGLREEILFKGFTDNPFQVYNNVDAILVCSRNEAWGRVAAEAMISGKPVIGYSSGGTKEIIIDKFNGLLYKNIDDLAECMQVIISDQELVKKLVMNSKKIISENFNTELYTTKILKLIKKVAFKEFES